MVIAADKSKLVPGAEVNFRCMSTDAPDTGLFLAYLCRNQVIIDVNMWDSQKKETDFHLRSVQLDSTGNYSCVVSELPLAATESDACGKNAVLLEVYSKYCICSRKKSFKLFGVFFFFLLCLTYLLTYRFTTKF